MKLRPLGARVLVKRSEEAEKTTGGIIIPDTAKEKPKRGKIIAAGPGATRDDGKIQPMEVKKGDEILFGSYAGTEVKIEGEDLLIMQESDILGVVE